MKEIIEEIKNKLGFEKTTFSVKEKVQEKIKKTEKEIKNIREEFKTSCVDVKSLLGVERRTLAYELEDWKDLLNDLEKLQEEENKPFDPLQLSDEFIDCGLIELDEGNFYCWSLFLDGFLYQNKKYEHLVIYQNKNDLYTFELEFDEERQLKEPNVDIVKDVVIPNHRFGKELLRNLGVID